METETVNSQMKHPFYKSLQVLFNSTILDKTGESIVDKRNKDIIYSKLQKHRSSIDRLMEVVNEMRLGD